MHYLIISMALFDDFQYNFVYFEITRSLHRSFLEFLIIFQEVLRNGVRLEIIVDF